MELKEFIVSAISDIASAVSEADEILKPMGGLMNPGDITTKMVETFDAPRTTLHFDIAVAAQSSTGVGAGVKAKIHVIEASVGGKGEVSETSTSRLTFSLDVVLPHDPNQEARIPRYRDQ